MKKYISNIRTLAALLMAGATFAACSSDDSIIGEQPANQQVYTMTVNATKGDGATTRALSLDDSGAKNVLTATWATTENIYVKKGSDWAEGSLQPDADGAIATLKGALSGIDIDKDDVLTLQFPKGGDISYEGQLGTLADIAANFDYATASVTVESVSEDGNIIPTEATTTFQSQQAIVKFTLVDKADENSLNAMQLTVNDGTNTYTVTPESATSEIYVAIPGIASQTVTLTATVGEDTYTCENTGVSFTNGKYYEIGVKMTKQAAGPTYPLLSAATTADYGKVVCAAGHLHDAKTAVPDGCTAVGILGKVTETGHGLILALQNAKSQNWNTINGWTSVTTYAGTTLKVLPDDAARGTNLTSYTTLGETAVSNWAVAQKSDYDAIFTNLGSTKSDSDGTTYDGNVNAYITTGVGGDAISGIYWSATENYDDFAWYFNSFYWYDYHKSRSDNVRPVLGFGGEAEEQGSAAEGHALSASAVGEIVGTDGLAYAAADKDNLPEGVTAAAMVAYKSETTGYSLAIALADEGSMNWDTAKSTCEGKTAIGGNSWKLPSQEEWMKMFSANGDNMFSYSGLNTAITNAGGTALQEGIYWSSSESEEIEEDAYGVACYGGSPDWDGHPKDMPYIKVRACLVF